MKIQKIHFILIFALGFFVLFAFEQSWPTAFCLLVCAHAYLEKVKAEEIEKSLDYQILKQRLTDLDEKLKSQENRYAEIIRVSEDTKAMLSKASLAVALRRQ